MKNCTSYIPYYQLNWRRMKKAIYDFTGDPFLFFVLLLFPLFAGGYHIFYCAAFSVLLILLLICRMIQKKELQIYTGYSSVVLVLITVLYLISRFWAVDKSMAFAGALKYVCVFLFCVNFWQVDKEKRKKLFSAIPCAAVLMTVISLIGGCFENIKYRFYDEAGDLNGTFEYANVFALFLLASIVILVFNCKKYIVTVFASGLCLYGIYASNARAVWLLTIAAFLLLFVILLYNKKGKKSALIFLFAFIGIAIVSIIALLPTGYLRDIANYLNTDGSLNERLLYYQDAFRYAVQHPFGKGAYAFYYAQPEFQSGYYYAIDVHCDFLQMMVEIGIVPAAAFVGMVLVNLFAKKNSQMQRVLLLIIALHSLIDYDLQFAVMLCILFMCVTFNHEKQLKIKSNLICVLCAAALIIMNAVVGLSAFYNYIGRHEKALQYFNYTPSLTIQMLSTNDKQTGYQLATKVLDINESVFEANQVLSGIYAADGRYEEAVAQMELVLQKNPRNMEHWRSYIDLCLQAKEYYISKDNSEMANECSNKIVLVEKRINELKANTSERAIKYGREQNFDIGGEYRAKIANCR